MSICRKCGASLKENDLFCGECGTKTEDVKNGSFCPNCGTAMQPDDVFCAGCGYAAKSVNHVIPQNTTGKISARNNTTLIVAIIAAAVVIITVCVMVIFMVSGTEEKAVEKEIVVEETKTAGNLVEDDSADKTEEVEKAEKAEKIEYNKKQPVHENLNDKLNKFISEKTVLSDMSVAIINNRNGDIYTSQYANDKYVAWGWYLPIYLVYSHQSSYNHEIAEGVMSSDAGVCNNSANTVIKAFGGPASVTERIKNSFGTDNTIYGRYFGDVNAVSENYTTPVEAAAFLQYLNERGEYAMLSYNISGFGINAPYNANVYAQVGTENRNVRNELNIFAVVKGARTDYCVAIMTRNSSGRYISELLQFINTEMELRANE